MPSFNTPIKCSSVIAEDITANKLNVNNVSFNACNRYINVKNSNNKDVFWVDDNGANISALETKTNFVSLTDTADALGENDSLVKVKEGKLEFSKEIDLDCVKSKHVKTEKLSVKNINLDSLVSKSILGDNCTLDKVHADEISSRAITTGDLSAKKLKCDGFKTELLEVVNHKCEKLISEDLETDNIITKDIIGVNGNIENFKSQNVNILNLQASQFHGDSSNFDKGACKQLEAVDFKTVTLKALDAAISELEVTRLLIKHQGYGTIKEPLNLALTQTRHFELEKGYMKHKLITRVPANVKTQSFYLLLNSFQQYDCWNISVCLTTDNEAQATLILLDDEMKVNISYKKAVEEGTLAVVLLTQF